MSFSPSHTRTPCSRLASHAGAHVSCDPGLSGAWCMDPLLAGRRSGTVSGSRISVEWKERENARMWVRRCVCIEGALLIVMCVYDIRQEASIWPRPGKSEVSVCAALLPRGREEPEGCCRPLSVHAVTRS